jgi:ureidoacrylate peracid hydrolase
MHSLNYPQAILDRIRARRGDLHVYDRLIGVRTALLVIDLQRAYMEGHGAIMTAREIVPNVNRLAAHVRVAGGTVVWIKNTLKAPAAADWPTYTALRSSQFVTTMTEALAERSAQHDLWPELERAPADIVHNKYRYSAFAGDAHDLEPVLRPRGIDTVLVCGTVTNVCCETTARDAMMRNLHVVMVSDANAARTDEEHVNSLLNIWQFFGDVMTTDEVLDRLR